MNDIRTGIIGLTPDATQLIRELDKNESFHLKAVAGKDHELLEDIAQQYDVNPYDDYRSLIVEENLDALSVDSASVGADMRAALIHKYEVEQTEIINALQ
ncbi:MAG: hypothetical protein IIB66_06535 [Proteobacteria bacterium]|nr:hypothetical protein [Pseudomonadota bacterium]